MSAIAALRTETAARPSPGGARTLELILAVVRARAQRLVALMERAWSLGRTSPDQGLAISSGEVAWLLAGEAARRDEAAWAAAQPGLVALAAEIARTEAALARDANWAALAQAFALEPDEADLLALLAAAEADPGLQRVVAYLHDNIRLTQPTLALCARLADRPYRLSPLASILRWRLAMPVDDEPAYALTSGWRLDPAVLFALQNGVWSDPAIADGVRTIGASELAGAALLQPLALAALERTSDLTRVELTGPPGIGRQTLAAQFAAGRGQPLVAADLALLAARGLAPREAITRVLRQAAFSGALAYFRETETTAAGEWEVARSLGAPFLRGARAGAAGGLTIPLAALTLTERLALWRARSGAPPPEMLRSHRLTPAEVDRLAGAAGDAPAAPPRTVRPDHGLLARLPCPYDWDDLILPAGIARQLREFTDQVRLRWSVYDEWGFGHLAQMGHGIASLFGGPSGTGKTMAAQVIARTLGFELYRVDLAGVVNKYVGETEKKLREVFDACEDTGALLFFDEADALFGGRVQVKDAHDRFANIEINYLLQRIETFDGVAILATNRRDDIDEAFVRRLRFIIEFVAPQAEERMILWRRALRAASPAGEALLDEIDWALLAERLTMTGAAIKNTALSAAFLARAEGSRIGMPHILRAAERELAKQHDKLPMSLRRGEGR